MTSTRKIAIKLNEDPINSKTEPLNLANTQLENNPTTVLSSEKQSNQRWKGSRPTESLSKEEVRTRSAENIKKMNDATPNKRTGNTLYASKSDERGSLFRFTYPADQASDDEGLMSTGLYVKLT
jgi:hypothetical protein